MIIYTLGTAGKNPETIFSILKQASIEHVIDVRLDNKALTNGFAKRYLPYFLSLINIRYNRCLDLAPTRTLLTQYRATNDWSVYACAFIDLMIERCVMSNYDSNFFHRSVLLGTEPTADFCHRRLVAEFVVMNMDGMPSLNFDDILHL